VILPASYVWNEFWTGNEGIAQLAMMGGMIAGLVFSLATIFKNSWAPVTAPLYAVAEGFFLGGVSSFYELRFPGVVIQTVGLTFAVLAALLLLYKSRVIPVTQNFRLGVAAGTGALALFYLVSFVLSMFGVRMGYLHEGSLLGIGLSVLAVVLASANLVLDFDYIESGAARGAPKYMEWYGAFALTVTLVWLYLELLRLLSKLQSRR
jgi:uncharacterized YccA/Bax inhibitor family protein